MDKLLHKMLRRIPAPANSTAKDYPFSTVHALASKELKWFGKRRMQRLVLAAWDTMTIGKLH